MTDQEHASRDWAHTAGERLRNAELQIPADVQLKLQDARRAAVMSAETATPQPWQPWYATAASGTVVAVAALVIVLMSGPQMIEIPNLNEQELAAAQEVELLEELEFVAWMLTMEDIDESPSQG